MRAHKGIPVICLGALITSMLAGCISTTPRTIKIGLVAPFEGRYREIGVDVIPAARLAIREWAAQHQDAPIVIELVAYDDGGNPEQARFQAEKLAADPDVAVVIGHWREDTTSAAQPIYDSAGLPIITFSTQAIQNESGLYNLAPSAAQIEQGLNTWAADEDRAKIHFSVGEDILNEAQSLEANPGETLVGGVVWGLNQFYLLAEHDDEAELFFLSGFAEPNDVTGWTDEQASSFISGYEAGSLGAPPGLLAVSAYQATWLAIRLIMEQHGLPTNNLLVQMGFDADQRLANTPIYLYRWHEGQRELVATFP